MSVPKPTCLPGCQAAWLLSGLSFILPADCLFSTAPTDITKRISTFWTLYLEGGRPACTARMTTRPWTVTRTKSGTTPVVVSQTARPPRRNTRKPGKVMPTPGRSRSDAREPVLNGRVPLRSARLHRGQRVHPRHRWSRRSCPPRPRISSCRAR